MQAINKYGLCPKSTKWEQLGMKPDGPSVITATDWQYDTKRLQGVIISFEIVGGKRQGGK